MTRTPHAPGTTVCVSGGRTPGTTHLSFTARRLTLIHTRDTDGADMRTRATPRASRRPLLRLEALEPREVPAVLLQIDYSYDTGFFKNNADARAVVERVATDLGNSLNANLAAIAPGGSNTWTATFYNPATGAEVSVPNLAVGANAVKVYVGARNIPGAEGGFGGAGGYVLSGSKSWNNATLNRGHSGYAPWGGSITFDSSERWHYGLTTAGLDSTEIDLYTVAMHEMAHLLGFGTAPQWTANVSGSTFVGSSSRSAHGGPVPLSADRAHWADGVTSGRAATLMDPVLPRGTRVAWTALDAAGLRDIGWGATPISPPATAPPPIVSPPLGPPPPVTAPVPAPAPPVVQPVPLAAPPTVAFAGGADGTLAVYRLDGGALTATGQRFTPFPGYRGELRVAGGDFNGDGVTDYAIATGPGVAAVAVLNGKDGSFLVGPALPMGGITGGLYVAAADIDRDGAAELVVAAGQGAPLVQTYRVNGGLQLQSSFVAFDAPGWRGGIRVAAGDVNGDGYGDVVVTTGSLVAAVGVYSGAGLRTGRTARLIPDFLPFGALPVGVSPAVGDMDGDGFAEVALSLERGAIPAVVLWSGKELSRGAVGSPAAVFLALPVDTFGARSVIRDLNGDGKAELVVAGGGSVGVARAFTFEQALAGGTGAASVYPPVAGGAMGIYVG